MDMKRWSGVILLGTAACLLGHSAQVQQAARDGLALCGASVIPALFPFFVVTGLAVRLDAAAALEKPMERLMGPLFRLSGACAAPLLAGLVGGYPTGARAAAELWREGRISREEAERLLGFCNNCGPGFILGFVGAGVFRESRTGAALYAIHVLSALATGWLLCRWDRREAAPGLPCRALRKAPSFAAAFRESVSGAAGSTLSVCAYVVLFRALGAAARLPAAMTGLLELVSGIAALEPGANAFAAAAGMLGWGGLCVHCQAMSVTEGLSLRRHLAGKAAQGALSVLMAIAVGRWLY